MKAHVIYLIASLLALGCVSMGALVDFNVVDTWDLGRRVTGMITPVGDNRFLSAFQHNVSVYEASPTSLERVQTLYMPDMISSWYNTCIDGGHLYVSTQYTGVLVYQIQPDITLSYLGKIPLQPGFGGLDYNTGVWAIGDTLVVSVTSMDYDTGAQTGYYYDVYDISNFASPLLLARHQLLSLDILTGVIPVPGGYYLTGFQDTAYYTPDLLSFQEVNMLQDHSDSRVIRNSFWYMGKLHYLKQDDWHMQLQRYSIADDHSLSPDWTIDIPQFNFSCWYLAEPDRVSIVGSDSEPDFSLVSFIPSAGNWTQEYTRPWTGLGIHKLSTGYLGCGEGKADFYDQQLSLVNNICSDDYQRAIGLIANRWVMFRSLRPPSGEQLLNFYDLVNRQWLDVQELKSDIISKYRKGTDYLCLAEAYSAKILRFQPDGNCQVTTYNLPNFCWGLDIWGDRMAVLHPIGGMMVLKVYDISSGAPAHLASWTLGPDYTNDVLFYGPNHLAVARTDADPIPSIDLFRLETSGNLTHLANLVVLDYDQLYVVQTRILTGRAGAAVIDISDPDDPRISGFTDPMVASAWNGGYISQDDGNNYLFSDSMMWLSYITDTNFHVRDTFISEYSWYRSPNRILLQSYNTLLEVEHQAYVGVDDPVFPGPAIPLGLPYPNPFSASVKLDVELWEQTRAQVDIYNVKGQKVRDLEESYFSKGKHTLSWDGCDGQGRKMPAGVYILRLKCSGESHSRRLILTH